MKYLIWRNEIKWAVCHHQNMMQCCFTFVGVKTNLFPLLVTSAGLLHYIEGLLGNKWPLFMIVLLFLISCSPGRINILPYQDFLSARSHIPPKLEMLCLPDSWRRFFNSVCATILSIVNSSLCTGWVPSCFVHTVFHQTLTFLIKHLLDSF